MKISRARVLFQVGVHAILVAHILAFYFLDWKAIGSLDFPSFFHDGLSRGVITAGVILGLAAFGGTLIFGRLFCSWGCHFGAFQDLAAWILRKLRIPLPHVRTRFLHWTPYVLLAVIFLVPALKTWSTEGLPTETSIDLGANPPWAALPGLAGSVITFLACGAGILLFLGTRGFCRFVCPYGAGFRIFDRLAPLRIRKKQACGGSHESCGPSDVPPCTSACPTAIDVHAETETGGQVRDLDCVRCHLCIEACPRDALELSFRPAKTFEPVPRPVEARPTIPLTEEIVFALVAILAYVAWDMLIAAHFLAATLALGEGFLVATCLRASRSRSMDLAGRIPLRREGRWTLRGALFLGLVSLTFIPLGQAAAFKVLKLRADRDFEAVFGAESPEALPGNLPPLEGQPPRISDPVERRRRLEILEKAHSRALSLFPENRPVKMRYIITLSALEDPRARLELSELEARADDPRLRELRAWVESRLPAPGEP